MTKRASSDEDLKEFKAIVTWLFDLNRENRALWLEIATLSGLEWNATQESLERGNTFILEYIEALFEADDASSTPREVTSKRVSLEGVDLSLIAEINVVLKHLVDAYIYNMRVALELARVAGLDAQCSKEIDEDARLEKHNAIDSLFGFETQEGPLPELEVPYESPAKNDS